MQAGVFILEGVQLWVVITRDIQNILQGLSLMMKPMFSMAKSSRCEM
jgi:hypothetical protein